MRLLLGALGALGALAGCAGRQPAPPSAAPAAPPHETDASYDWHVLLIAPFGSTLKSVTQPLHEALLFRDESGDPAAADEGECYAPDAAPPRFLAHTPEELLLCFRRDRLMRIRASVRLEEAQAEASFAEACARWQRSAADAVESFAAPQRSRPAPNAQGAADHAQGAGIPLAATPETEDGGCSGHSGPVRFSARLGPETESTAAADAADADDRSTVTIVLDGTD